MPFYLTESALLINSASFKKKCKHYLTEKYSNLIITCKRAVIVVVALTLLSMSGPLNLSLKKKYLNMKISNRQTNITDFQNKAMSMNTSTYKLNYFVTFFGML